MCVAEHLNIGNIIKIIGYHFNLLDGIPRTFVVTVYNIEHGKVEFEIGRIIYIITFFKVEKGRSQRTRVIRHISLHLIDKAFSFV